MAKFNFIHSRSQNRTLWFGFVLRQVQHLSPAKSKNQATYIVWPFSINFRQTPTFRPEKLILLFIFASLFLASCASVPTQGPVGAAPTEMVYTQLPSPLVRGNLYHEVGPGETLWRISKMYDVKIEDILKANGLKPSEELREGQRLLVPNAAPIRPVVPLWPSHKWQYIIIHHSATDMGSALRFNYYHLRRLWRDGLGYHFVIDNGTCDKVEGQIEVSPRWIKQKDGAHCKAAGMNYKAIGICLVGNFDKEKISPRQFEALVALTHALRTYYHIPISHIIGHGQVPAAYTDCPGKNFPWREFYSRLNKLEQEAKK